MRGEGGVERPAESAVEGVGIDHLAGQPPAHDVRVGGVAESGAGVGPGGDAGGGVHEDGVERAGANRRPDAQEGGEELTGEVLDFGGRQGRLHPAHGWLRGSVAW